MTVDRVELLSLMGSARGRFTTARATIREWRDEATADEVRERTSESGTYRRSLGSAGEPRVFVPSRREESERIWRVWHEKPNRWRQEIEPADGPGTEYRVVDGDDFWYYNPRHGARHAIATGGEFGGGFGPEFNIAHVFDPAVPHLELEVLELRSADRIWVAGREAIRVEAVKPGGWDSPPEPLWWGADDYELVVDAERGVILRLASRLDRKAFDVTEVLDIAFDDAFPEDTFVLQLPGVRFDVTDRLT